MSAGRPTAGRPWRLAAVLLALAALTLGAGGQGFPQKASLELAADRDSYAAGDAVRLAARVEIENHWHVNSHTPTFDWLIPTELTIELPAGWGEVELRYPAHEMQKFPFAPEPIAVYDGTVTIYAGFTLPAELEAGSVELDAELRYQACDDKQCLPPVTTSSRLELELGATGGETNRGWFEDAADAAGAPPGTAPPAAAGSEPGRGLAGILLLALLGGLILNAMPCVLPVLSLKVFALVKSAGHGRSQLLVGSLATTGGILLSFWMLALAAVLAARAGAAVGWGVQFQEPGFVAFLAVVVVLFSLNMWGLFEIPLPQSLARASGAGPSEGLAGHFASGLFATLMATPCSAPFLGTAVGFALSQPPVVVFAVFTAVGLGLALPYLLLAALPRAAGWLPKPGPWMVTFKHVLGFLLAAAAVWLFYVLAAQIAAEQLAYLQLALLLMALSTWLFGHWRERPGRRRLALAGTAVGAVLAIALAASAPSARAGGIASSELIDWVQFDETEARSLADEGRLVFVDVTADWCLTCKTTERLVIETPEVADAFERYGVVAMKADWTNRDDTITAFLRRFGKAAVPFYVLYRPGQEPHAFGELLTRSSLLQELDRAAPSAVASGP